MTTEGITDAMRAAAADWLARLHRHGEPDWSDPTLARWLAEDPRHRLAFSDASADWFAAGELSDVECVDDAQPRCEEMARHRSIPPAPARKRAALWATFSLMALVALWFAPQLQHGLLGLRYDLVGAPGQMKTVRLVDGSSIRLTPDAVLDESFSAAERRVVLHAGSAYFDVETDPNRPFRVVFEFGEVEVVGTAFGVGLAPDGASVGVFEGLVRAVSRDQSEQELLRPGDQRRVGSGGLLESTQTPEQAFDWADGSLRFQERSLSEVLSALAPYLDGRLLVLTNAADDIEVTAAIDLDRIEQGMETLALQSGLTVSKLPGLVVIH